MLRYWAPLEMNIIGRWTRREIKRGESPASSSVGFGAFLRNPERFRIHDRRVHIALVKCKRSPCVSGHLKKVKKEAHHLNFLPPPQRLSDYFSPRTTPWILAIFPHSPYLGSNHSSLLAASNSHQRSPRDHNSFPQGEASCPSNLWVQP